MSPSKKLVEIRRLRTGCWDCGRRITGRSKWRCKRCNQTQTNRVRRNREINKSRLMVE